MNSASSIIILNFFFMVTAVLWMWRLKLYVFYLSVVHVICSIHLWLKTYLTFVSFHKGEHLSSGLVSLSPHTIFYLVKSCKRVECFVAVVRHASGLARQRSLADFGAVSLIWARTQWDTALPAETGALLRERRGSCSVRTCDSQPSGGAFCLWAVAVPRLIQQKS